MSELLRQRRLGKGKWDNKSSGTASCRTPFKEEQVDLKFQHIPMGFVFEIDATQLP